MKLPRLPYRYLFIILGGVLSILVCVKIFPLKTTADLITFTTTVIGLLVSFTAFIIAMKTYLSIDSVNVITQMEGNVLENENYITAITSLLKEYDMKDSKSVADAIFSNLESRFAKNSKTAIAFANNLQYFIDIIVFFPSLIHSDNKEQEENIDRVNRIIGLIEKRKDALLAISTGNLILIEETVKLIKCVMHYQKLIHTNEYKITSSLLEVRGTMLKNSVTQTVYYNYLGLFYNKKATYILRNKFKLGNEDLFKIDILKQIKNNIETLTDEETELFLLYLQESKKAFKKALANCNEDVMWEGFIKYNDARSTYFLQLINPDHSDEDWHIIMNEAVIARTRLNILINDILDYSYHTHLQESFIYQEYLARLVKTNLLMAEEQDITDTQGKPIFRYPDYVGLTEDRFIKYPNQFQNINQYQIHIQNQVNPKG